MCLTFLLPQAGQMISWFIVFIINLPIFFLLDPAKLLSEEKCLCLFAQTMETFPLNKRGESFYRIKKKLIKKFDQKKYILNSSSGPTSYFLLPNS